MSEAFGVLNTIPVGPLGIIALPGCEELAQKIDGYISKWREERDSEHKSTIAFYGYQRESYIIKTAFLLYTIVVELINT